MAGPLCGLAIVTACLAMLTQNTSAGLMGITFALVAIAYTLDMRR